MVSFPSLSDVFWPKKKNETDGALADFVSAGTKSCDLQCMIRPITISSRSPFSLTTRKQISSEKLGSISRTSLLLGEARTTCGRL